MSEDRTAMDREPHGPDQGEVERALSDYAASLDDSPSPGFGDWVMRSVEAEPLPRRGLVAALAHLLLTPGPNRAVAQLVFVVAVLAAGIGSAVAVAQISELLPDAVDISPSPMPSHEASPSPSPIGSPSPSAEPTPPTMPSEVPTTVPTPEESEDEAQTEEPSETPRPGETPDSG